MNVRCLGIVAIKPSLGCKAPKIRVGASSAAALWGYRGPLRSLQRSKFDNNLSPYSQKMAVRKLCAGIVSSILVASPAAAASDAIPDGEALFQSKCVACHVNGGNVVQRNKTLQLEILEKNGYSDLEEVNDIIAYGQGKMPGYGELCQPRGACTFGARLTQEEIITLSQYVLDKAKAGW